MTVSRISVSISRELLREFEEAVKRTGYEDRSKAVHAALRSFIAESEWASKTDESEGAGAILLVYDHEVKGLEAALTDAQHAYRSIIAASMHLHLDERNCLLVIGVRGLNKKIKALTKDLAACRGVKQLKLSFVKP